MSVRLSGMCIAALALSAVRCGTPPPPVLITSGPFLRCPWGIPESLDVDGEPWWQSALTDDSSQHLTWYEHFIRRRQGGAMLGPIFAPIAPQRVWEPDPAKYLPRYA